MAYWTTALLGSTNKFFMPWLVPRNDKGSVYTQNILGKLFRGGRRRRDAPIGQEEEAATVLNAIEDIEDLESAKIKFCHESNVDCLYSAATEAHQKFLQLNTITYGYNFEDLLKQEFTTCQQVYNQCVKATVQN